MMALERVNMKNDKGLSPIYEYVVWKQIQSCFKPNWFVNQKNKPSVNSPLNGRSYEWHTRGKTLLGICPCFNESYLRQLSQTVLSAHSQGILGEVKAITDMVLPRHQCPGLRNAIVGKYSKLEQAAKSHIKDCMLISCWKQYQPVKKTNEEAQNEVLGN